MLQDNDNITRYSINYDWQDLLATIGIDILTGEACSLSMRLLCEVTEQAKDLFLEYFGLSGTEVSHSTWNDRTKYALFLDRGTIEKLVIFYLCHNWPVIQEVRVKDNTGFTPDLQLYCANSHEDIRDYIEQHKPLYDYYNDDCVLVPGTIFHLGRSYSTGKGPRQGMSNVHAMSGNYQ